MEAKHVILGTVGLGIVLGVVALTRKKETPDALPEPRPDRTVPEEQSARAPATPAAYLTGTSLAMRQGGRYRARLNTAAGTGPFATDATRERLAAALDKLGFRDTIVYMTPAELPGWSAEDAGPANPAARWFFGRWGVADLEVPRPSSLESIRLTSARG